MTEATPNEAQSPALAPYLQETPVCNYSHPAIQEIVHAVTDGCVDDTDRARRIFYYVRDSTRFALLGSGFDITDPAHSGPRPNSFPGLPIGTRSAPHLLTMHD